MRLLAQPTGDMINLGIHYRTSVVTFVLACLLVLAIAYAQETEQAIERLKLPGIKINLDERCVDVESTVCLDEGTLEWVACTKHTKEHESIVATNAKAIHLHTALLLLGAKPGNPAAHKQVGDDEETRWIDVPPSGHHVEVFLVIETEEGKPVERPISDFIKSVHADEKEATFPSNIFLFAGSHLIAEGKGPRTYGCDRSGNVISITTFGDELLCLPDVYSHENGALRWQIDSSQLPRVGTQVTLRLRPKEADKEHPPQE
ncbi:MAG: hypothetical protein GWQ05_25370 [Verrucomicrobiaceae bacterium]|nr:hypothetical protein [Verrucomicrobiaceae bacterium]